jgi:septation ring formation regulator EzrA
MSLPSDPAARKAIKKCMDELSASMARTEGEREFIKEAINNICEEYELSKKTFRKLAKVYHKQNFSKEVAENEEFETMYEQLTGETSLGDIK